MGSPLQMAFFLLLALTLGIAFWRGGGPERYGAAVLAAMFVVQGTMFQIVPSGFYSVDPVPLVTDIIGFAGFGAIAMNARRIWPLWAAALQLLAVSAHFARWADLAIHAQVYAFMRSGPTFLALIALFAGTVLHRVRQRRWGFDPAWQDWSVISAGSGRCREASSKR